MSENLAAYNLRKYKDDVGIHHNFSLQYVRRQCVGSEELAFNVEITNRCIKSWGEFKNSVSGVSYVDIKNTFLQAKDIQVRIKDSEDFETHFTTLYVKVCNSLKGKIRHKYEKIYHAKRNIVICWGDLKSMFEAERKLTKPNEKLEAKEKECFALHEQCEHSCTKVCKTKVAEKEVEKLVDNIERVERENVHLYEYISKIVQLEKCENIGKKVSKVK